MKIRNQDVEVDIKKEIKPFLPFQRMSIKNGKLIACSPFRTDTHPSFFLRLEKSGRYEAGVWSDAGSVDPQLSSGTFPKLLALLKNQPVKEIEDELLDKYGGNVGYVSLSLDFDFKDEKPVDLKNVCSHIELGSDYLTNRGIPITVQRRCGVRDGGDYIAIPWKNSRGDVLNIKYRHKKQKAFWYEKGGVGIEHLVWGLDTLYDIKADYAVLTESETDAMSAMAAGFPAIALGGINLSNEKQELILKSPIKRLYLATDNDEAGRKIKEGFRRQFSGLIDLYDVRLPQGVKDLNELHGAEEIKQKINCAKKLL